MLTFDQKQKAWETLHGMTETPYKVEDHTAAINAITEADHADAIQQQAQEQAAADVATHGTYLGIIAQTLAPLGLQPGCSYAEAFAAAGASEVVTVKQLLMLSEAYRACKEAGIINERLWAAVAALQAQQ